MSEREQCEKWIDSQEYEPMPSEVFWVYRTWEARADLAVEEVRELVEALKMVLPLAWRDHRYKEEQLLLENTERLVAKIDAQRTDE